MLHSFVSNFATISANNFWYSKNFFVLVFMWMLNLSPEYPLFVTFLPKTNKLIFTHKK